MSNQQELSGSHAGGQMNEDAIDASGVNDILMAGDKSKGARPYFLNDPAVERVLNITMAVATELAVVRERLDTIERLLQSKNLLSQVEIEAFVPTDEQAEERQLWHARYAARIMRIVQQELDAIAKPENNTPMRQIADEINEM
jgi:F420-dependent methylenetetrahydromethanopterin dehydrogenase